MVQFKKAEDIKVGVIGYGGAFNMGKVHLEQMQAAGMTPVAVVDLDSERHTIARTDFPGIKTYTSLGRMMHNCDVDLVTIITPHNTHAKLALQALRAGKHVVCEKPLALTTAECDAMIRTAKENDVMISTYHNRHWDGCILEAVKNIKSGMIGDIYRIEAHMGSYAKPGDWWRTSRTISGGILYDWGVHLLEYSLQLIDAGITEVTGFSHTGFWGEQTAWLDDANEDEGFAVVRFDNGTWLTLCITTLDSNPKKGQLEITGTKGTYIFAGGTWEAITHDGEKVITTQGLNPPSEGERYYQNVADHLVKGEELVITGEWSRRPIHILDLAKRSAETGKACKARYS